ncbi:hypothetical protein AcW1_002608 [Taiwanofungus camphoratus]|nr:hypothetical protein AcV5_009710 [Antrodia cinnamomea]KAI0942832.1 hypothetical protein AcV7_002134 [Antrodia cinnamomea]KAI0943451.1 hypothetical protein AcW1_002608 [Antrodia cinnamomea]
MCCLIFAFSQPTLYSLVPPRPLLLVVVVSDLEFAKLLSLIIFHADVPGLLGGVLLNPFSLCFYKCQRGDSTSSYDANSGVECGAPIVQHARRTFQSKKKAN